MAKELTHEEVLKEVLKDPEVKREYDALEKEFEAKRKRILRALSKEDKKKGNTSQSSF